MGTLTGSNLTLYTGDLSRVIGCEVDCSLNITSELVETSTIGSGKAVSRDYLGYDWSVSSNGVIFIQDNFDGTGNLDPFEFADYIIRGTKVFITLKVENGATDKFYFGRGVIVSAQYTGSAEDLARYTVEIQGDGQLYRTANMINDNSSPASVSGTLGIGVFVFDSTSLYQKSVFAVLINGVAITSYTFNPTQTGTEGRITVSGTDLLTSRTIEVWYQ